MKVLHLLCLRRSCAANIPQLNSFSESQSELLDDWRYTAIQFVLASIPLRLTTRIFFQLSRCSNSPYVTSSLTEDGFVSYEYA
jgi:hypothetical protein